MSDDRSEGVEQTEERAEPVVVGQDAPPDTLLAAELSAHAPADFGEHLSAALFEDGRV
jgi:hypothetical protein